MMASYALVFSVVTVARFYALRTYAYDLGNYNQAMYTTLRGYGLLYYTADLPVTGGSMMGVHFSPILLILLPIYALYPFPPTLLVLKSFVLALGAYPVYGLAKHFLKTRSWGILFAAAYLLNPLLQGINWFDFHPEAFFPTFFLFSLYYGLKGDWRKYILFTVLTLTTTEYASVLILTASVYLLWMRKSDVINSLKPLRHLKFKGASNHFKYPFIALCLAVVWFFIALQVVSAFSPSNPMVKGGAPQWSILGADGTLSVPLQVILAPQRALAALTYDWQLKLAYTIILFGSTMFLSFLNPKSLVMTLPWLMVALLSNYSAFYYIGNQYPAFLVPEVIVGSVLGAKKLLESCPKGVFLEVSCKLRTISTSAQNIVHAVGSGRRFHVDLKSDSQRTLSGFLLVFALVFSILCSPLYGPHLGNWPDLTYGIEPITEHSRVIMQTLSLVPSSAGILTQSNIFPLVSSRTNSFIVPLGSFYPPGTSFNSTLEQWLREVDFVLIDFETNRMESTILLSYIKDYGVYAANDGVILLKRGYYGPPVTFEPYIVELDYEKLTLMSGEVVRNANSESAEVLLHRANVEPVSDFWRSTDLYLPPGEYEISFRLKVTNRFWSNIVDVNVTGRSLQLSLREQGTQASGYKVNFIQTLSTSKAIYIWKALGGEDFSQANVYQEFKAKFDASVSFMLETGSTVVAGNTDVYLDWIKISQLKPLPSLSS